jgi:hypothetical protein
MTALMPFETGTVELEVDLAIGLGSAGWDVSAWDFDRWATEVSGAMVDVTCDVSEVTLSAGASEEDGILTAINASTGGITLRGSEYNPWTPPWGAALGPSIPCQIRWRHQGDAAWTVAFTGFTDGWPYDRATAVASVPLVDATAGLANMTLPTLPAGVGQGETIDQRMNRILNQAGWSTSLRSIPADPHTCISTTMGEAPWAMLQAAADTGIGLLWIKRTGEVAYLPVGQAGGWKPHMFGINLTDVHGGTTRVCVLNYQNSQPMVRRNAVSISRAADPLIGGDAPVAAIAQDNASIATYGPKTYSRDDLIHQADGWSATIAGAVLLDGAWPTQHPQNAGIDIRIDTRSIDLLMRAEIGDVIMVHDSGLVFECAVVGWNVDITRRDISGSLILSDVTRWVGGLWDTDGWDRGVWSI